MQIIYAIYLIQQC